jgi:hypothetical protein
MSDQIPTKKSFGSVRVNRFSPPKEAEWPKAINVHISFEEAMRLHLGLGQILGKLNSYDRSTKRGREDKPTNAREGSFSLNAVRNSG